MIPLKLTPEFSSLLAGLCAIAGVLQLANMLVTNFWMSTASIHQHGGDGADCSDQVPP